MAAASASSLALLAAIRLAAAASAAVFPSTEDFTESVYKTNDLV